MAEVAATRRRTRWFGVLVALVLLGSLALRAVTLTAALPYSTYVDEGHVVARVAHMVGDRTWDPDWYRYPSLLMGLTAAGTVPLLLTSDGLTDDADDAQADPYYDRRIVPELLLVGRLVVLLAAVALVGATLASGVHARGRATGLVAGALAAVAPALVSRGSIVIVDTLGALFVTLALLAAAKVGPGRRGVVAAGLAGVAVGLAITSKYTLGVVLLGVWAAIALDTRSPVVRRLWLCGLAGVAAAVAAVVTMPALVLEPTPVQKDIAAQADIYATKAGEGTYLAQLTSTAELGWLLPLVALLGLAVMAAEPRARRLLVAWAVFTVPFVGALLTSDYQPVRNLLPLVPLACVAAAVAVTRGADELARRVGPPRRVRLGATGAAALVLLAVVAGGTRDHLETQLDRVDSRVEARRWLEEQAPADGRVLVAEELAFLDAELDRIPGEVEVRSVHDETVDTADFDLVVVPSYAALTLAWSNAPTGYSTAHLGARATTTDTPDAWRGTDQIIDIYPTG